MTPPRLRFAPSPTGFLHIGGVRTALYCWLWAKQKGGNFILRIEDTDRDRHTPEAVDAIYESMKWLGLDWDEGPLTGGPDAPYFQSERLEVYRKYADKMLESGHAYRCYCSKEDLAAAREAHKQSGSKDRFRYPGTCRDRDDNPDLPWVLRFRVPEDATRSWNDLVKGEIEVPGFTHQDFVIFRQNGLPLYNFACVIDDAEMNIDTVIRGEDHVINTAPQILLYEALGLTVPTFGHLPLILANNGQKLSKRFAAVSTLAYREMGYLPGAVLNYLARLGWSHGDKEIFSLDELVELFNWKGCGTSGAKYDEKKFAHVQAEHLRAMPDADLAALVAPLFPSELEVDGTDARLLAALPMIKPRATSLHDIVEGCDYFFRDPPALEEKGQRKFLVPANAPRLRSLADLVEGVETFDAETLKAQVDEWLAREEIRLKEVAQPARVALSGRTKSPGIYEVMVVLGREMSLRRLRAGADLCESNEP
jgi:glutamyl-tRNA synthetase